MIKRIKRPNRSRSSGVKKTSAKGGPLGGSKATIGPHIKRPNGTRH